MPLSPSMFFFFFFNDTATTEIYTLSLHDALPIYRVKPTSMLLPIVRVLALCAFLCMPAHSASTRSEEHTSELQSQSNLVCRLLLEKKKKQDPYNLRPVHSLSAVRASHPHHSTPPS